MNSDQTQVLKTTWELVAENGDRVPATFYVHLWLMYPETRDLFPIHMGEQRDRLVTALGNVIANVDNLASVRPALEHLGRDHARRYGVLPKHYPWVRDALLATLEHFLSDIWTPELAHTWGTAYDAVAEVMVTAAQQPFAPEEVA